MLNRSTNWKNWISAHQAAILIVLVGLVLRMIYIFQVIDTPIFPMMATDSEYFDAMAHHYFHGHWGHPDAIFLNPLYPIFLSGIYACCHANLMVVIIVQVLLDSCSILLIAYIGAALLNYRAGIIAAGLYASYGIAIFYTGLLLAPSIAIFLSLSVIALLIRYQNAVHINWLPLAGFLFGLLVLARTNTVLFVPVSIIWIVLVKGTNTHLRKRLAACFLFIIGLSLPLMLNSIRNEHFFGKFHPFSVQGGINFYIGNNPDAEGIIMSPKGIPTLPVDQVKASTKLAEKHSGQSLSPFQASDYWLRQGLTYLFNQPFDALSLYVRKFGLFWRKEEITLNINYDLSRELLPIMNHLPLVSFGLVAPMALVGFFLALKRYRHTFLITAYASTYMFSVILFFISDRYRLPIAPYLCLLAGLAVDTTISNWRLKAWTHLLPTITIVCLTAFLINYNFAGFAEDDPGSRSIHYSNMGLGYKNKGDLILARNSLERAVMLDASSAIAFNNLGTVLLEMDDLPAAQSAFEKAIVLDASSCNALYNLGKCHQAKGEPETAKQRYYQAIACDPQFAEAHTNLAQILIKTNRFQEAENHLAEALASSPDLPEAHLTLGRLELKRDAPLKALDHIKKVIHDYPERPDGYVQLGLVHMQMGDPSEGLRAYETALALDPKNIDALVGSGMALLQQNRVEAAIVQLEKARLEKPDAPFTLGLLVQCYFLKGDMAATEAASRRLKAVAPALAQKVETMLSEKSK